MNASDPPPVASKTPPIADSAKVQAGVRPGRPDPNFATAIVSSRRRLEALEHAWELGEERFTAADCSTMPIKRLRRLCEEAFVELDADFPAWAARDEYEVLCAELTARTQAPEIV